MNPPSLRDIFEKVIDLPADQRAAVLDQLCGGDDVLRAQVQRLLESEAALAGFLERPLASLAPLLQAQVPAEATGEIIGDYQLQEVIGEGSFSRVWRAKQLNPIRRDVAVKLLKPGLDVSSIAQRFDQEREALARLEHPNISRIYDAGVHSSGRPYFVMELVRGAPIDAYCRDKKLAFREIAQLLQQAMKGVEHAHGAGLLHRDLKPQNILAGDLGGQPIVKVIDFGIAKLLSPDRTSQQTLAVFPLGSPAYMSPEQFIGSGEVDARADVYALGVILAELTAGRGELEEDDPAFLARLKREGVPDPLIAIIACATAAERNRRYESVAAFDQDLQRFIDGQRVLATPVRSPIQPRTMIAAVAGALGLLVILGVYLSRSAPPVQTPPDARWPATQPADLIWLTQFDSNQGWWSVCPDLQRRRIWCVGTTGLLYEVNLDTGAIVATHQPDGRWVIRVCQSEDGRRLAVVTMQEDGTQQRLLLLETEGLREIGRWDVGDAVYALTFVDRKGSIVALNRQSPDKILTEFIDTQSSKRTVRTRSRDGGTASAYLVSAGNDRDVITLDFGVAAMRIDSRTGAVSQVYEDLPGVVGIAVLAKHDRLAVLGGYELRLLKLSTGELAGRYRTPQPTAAAALSDDGKTLYVAVITGDVLLFDVLTGLPISESQPISRHPSSVGFLLKEGRYIHTTSEGSMSLFNLPKTQK